VVFLSQGVASKPGDAAGNGSAGRSIRRFISPWTAMVVTGACDYDFLAVRFGYMMWMVKKMSGSSTLPLSSSLTTFDGKTA